ncbi:MAG TPA: GNAT family N-acetyltransferase [Bacteroidetes bacterium]|nr:GNAT family N-acetyltransferase [Bacteroidota bacterium]
MYVLIRTNSDDPDFQKLVKELDMDLAIRDGEEHAFFAQFNKIDSIKFVVLAYENGRAVGCGAIKEYAKDTMEVKRMYVLPEERGKSIASVILNELEKWGQELNCEKFILETGIKQPEAIGLYNKNSYTLIPNYGQYDGVASSVCFEKYLPKNY